MTVPIAFAVIGGVILIGFFANLFFRATKIPSVLLLISIGIALGPATGWIASASLIEIAPFFGTMALLIILFQGGLELDLESVIKQAPKAALLAVLVFIFSAAFISAFAFFALRMPLVPSLLIAAIFSASSPAIILPLLSGLSVRKETQAILKLESALGDVLLIVTVVLILDFQAAGGQGAIEMLSRFFKSFAVAFIIASVAGALWSRLIGWMGKEPLAYMLTLGFVFLLYFSVEELGGSAAIAVLLFGILLENMHVIAGRVSARVRFFFGIDVRAEQFVLHEFMKNITEELSFLIRTFFFVYLGLILDFRSITLEIAVSSVGIVILLLAGRWIGVQSIRRKCRFTAGEMRCVMSMLPRGLATAVMAFLPAQYGIAGAEILPVYAFAVIVLTNIFMTGGVIVAERRLAREKRSKSGAPLGDRVPACVEGPKIDPAASETADEASGIESALPPSEDAAAEQAGAHFSFSDSMSRLFGIRREDRQWRYIEAIKASFFAQPLFWVQVFFASALTALGLVVNQSAVVIAAALIVPIAWPVIAAGMALAVGDMYLFLKLLLKIASAAAMTAAIAALCSGLLPFSALTAEIASRTRPTILDFLVAFFAGMAGAVMLFSRRGMLHFLPGAVLAVTLLPPLAVMGFGIGNSSGIEMFRGGAVFFTANFFAAILGASLIYAIVGMPEVAGLNGIHDWKRRELNQPFVKLIFERLKLKTLAGRTGSVRSRLVVACVFLLALVIPLQIAFNQLAMEFRARQAISDLEKMFELPGRSAIINCLSDIDEDEIAVKIQVATNSFFTASDIRHFEERLADRTGKQTRLDLVQSLSDIGEGQKIRGMLSLAPHSSAELSANISEITVGLRDAIERNLRLVPVPQSITILCASAELGLNQSLMYFRMEYLAVDPLSEDAGTLLSDLLERQMKLKSGSLKLVHVPSRYSFNLDRTGRISEKELAQLQSVQNLLTQHAQLGASIELPRSPSGEGADKLLRTLYDLAPMLENSSRVEIKTNQGRDRMLIVALRPVAAVADPNSGGSPP